jgi:hypothetical protein
VPDAAFFTRARAAAERRMVDTCTITTDPEFLDDSTLDDETLALSDEGTVTIYTGACLIAPEERQEAHVDEGGAPMVRRAYVADIPVDAAAVAIGAVLTVTASVNDPLLVGERFTVDGSSHGTQAFQRRLFLTRSVRADAQ